MIDTVYTIGYSGFGIDELINALQARSISLLVDVRSRPHSRYYPDYNKENLEQRLKKNHIYYRNYAKEFGARQNEKQYYADKGYLDFELFAQSPHFLDGVNRLIDSMAKDYRFALMCAEKDPFNCHRTIMVARAFHNAGYKVIHLLPDNKEITQDDIEKLMVEKYFPRRNQINLFDEKYTESDYVSMAYKKRNAEIGYFIEEESE